MGNIVLRTGEERKDSTSQEESIGRELNELLCAFSEFVSFCYINYSV